MPGDATMRIGDLAARAGVSVSTLRAWEDRYGVLAPARTTGGHRLYAEHDLARVEAVHALVAAGHTVAAAAAAVGAGGDDRGFTLSTLHAELAAIRAIVRAARVPEVTAALREFVTAVGGTIASASDGDALPLDLSLGEGPPVLPTAPAPSVARLELERALPPLVEDARMAVTRLRHLERRRARSR